MTAKIKCLAAVLLMLAMTACGGGGGNGGAPVLSLSQTILSFGASLGVAFDPAPQMVNVSNSGTGTLNFTTSSDSAWLTAVPGTGTAPSTITITAFLGSLTAGKYTGHVTVTATGAQGSPATITVTFTVTAQPVLALSNTALSFATFAGFGTDLFPVNVNVSNTGGGTLNFTAASDSAWLTVSPPSGSAPKALSISASLGTLTAATYTGHITVTASGAQGSPATITVTFTVAAPPAASNSPTWGQWGANGRHAGMVAVAAQNVTNQLADIVYDPFVSQEQAENAPVGASGDLVAHYQATITDGGDVYMEMKTGTYISCNPAGDWVNGTACGPNAWQSMIWNEARFSWLNGALMQVWNFASDWKPEPNATNFNAGLSGLSGWEPVFHPVDANNFIYVPGAGGSVWKVNKADGTMASHITPSFAGLNVGTSTAFVSSPLTADNSGNIYYNVIALANTPNPWNDSDVPGAWLVKIAPSDAATTVSYATLLPGAPAAGSGTCPGRFHANTDPLPWPPTSTAIPTQTACGSQRPGVNLAPAVAADGTIYTGSVAHFNSKVSYLVAVNPNLTVKWATSLQNLLSDGCGSPLLPMAAPGVTNEPNSCRNGTTPGVDPTTNAMGSGEILDQASSTPTVVPDGVLYGLLDHYNFARGHLMKFDTTGKFKSAFGFGWDSTPAVYVHGGTYSVLIKDNHYGAPAYCSANNPVCAGTPQMYFITQLDSNLNIEWQFQSTNTESCTRNPDGSVSCVSDHPNGFEWCINAPAIDSAGTVYVNSEDGNIYMLPQPAVIPPSKILTTLGSKLFLNLALGAAYTPLSIGPDGKLYTQNDGHLFVVGN